MLISVSFLSLTGKSFQILGPMVANELLWAIEVCDLVVGRRLLFEDLNEQLCDLITRHFRYSGAALYTQILTMAATLYHILSLTFGQCKSIRRGVILLYFPVLWMILHWCFAYIAVYPDCIWGYLVIDCCNNQSCTIPVPASGFLWCLYPEDVRYWISFSSWWI